ncbi:MAG: tRNA 2-thiouridine(34) synthase MnmA [Selenomonadaceae bacterium]|nr:tRNA 2-thiouridine(34) synthase MnmA [Selenomonadaceae bacterium]
MRKKVAVAMSGGVDSSLTAALLLERGFEVVGVTMQLDDDFSAQDAKSVASHLGIVHYVADFREIFRTEIEDYFVAEYLRGRTPNPCVRCNKKIKFGKLLDFAKSIGADYLATGHYARIVFEDGKFKLKKGVDLKKDQSYVLYNLTAENLSRIIFPLGEFSKTETRELAEKLKLPVANKPDSQEICFIPNDDYKDFISRRAGDVDALKAGDIVNTSGKVLGSHNGVANYTIGQRKGLGIAAEYPLYVVRIDVENHQVVVGKSEELFSDELTADNVHWIYKPENFPAKLQAKIRYGFRVSDCTVESFGDNLHVTFNEPQRAITKGQSIVFYDGDELLGGGIISGQ